MKFKEYELKQKKLFLLMLFIKVSSVIFITDIDIHVLIVHSVLLGREKGPSQCFGKEKEGSHQRQLQLPSRFSTSSSQ